MHKATTWTVMSLLVIPAAVAQSYYLVPDTLVSLGPGLFGPNSLVLVDAGNYDGILSLAEGLSVDAQHRLPTGEWLFSLSVPAVVGGIPLTPRDIVSFDGLVHTLFLDGAAQGIPAGTSIDALDWDPVSGSLLLSFDIPTSIGGTEYEPADLVEYQGGAFQPVPFFDASAQSPPLNSARNLTGAARRIGSTLLTFELETNLGGAVFAPGQLVDWDGASFALFDEPPGWPTASAYLAGLSLVPSSPEICNDMQDNDGDTMVDCNDPDCAGALAVDADGDGFTFCQGDCDDSDVYTYTGAPEVNDGRDNQCPNEPGAGLVDEVTGGLFPMTGLPDTFAWLSQDFAVEYQVLRSTSPDFIGDCTLFLIPDESLTDEEDPPPGEAFYYIVRSKSPYVGSWGEDGFGVERFPVCTSEADCTDGMDNDGDGAIDCADSDCLGTPPCPVFQFTDTLSDDLSPSELENFFSNYVPLPGDYIFFQFDMVTRSKAWCSEHADFYRDAYLSLAPTSGDAFSGPWSRWYRSPLTGNAWVGPDFSSYNNRFGTGCSEAFAWCAEENLGGFRLLVRPDAPANNCEMQDLNEGCSNGNWTLTIQVGPDRLETCGF